MTTGLLTGKVVVSLPRVSGIAADAVQNSFWFAMDDTTDYDSVEYTAITDRLITFFNTNPGLPATAGIANYLAAAISRVSNAARMVVYAGDTIDPRDPLGSPRFSRNWTVGAMAGGAVGQVAETALVLSYHADLTDIPETQTNPSPPPATIRPAAHRRGRIYIGPPNSGAVVENGGSLFEVVPSPGVLNAMAGAAADLLAANSSDWTWMVASQATGTEYPIVGGFVDNAFDTQRRRGHEASSRQLWP